MKLDIYKKTKNTGQSTVDACSLLHMHKERSCKHWDFSTIDTLVVQLQPNLVTVGYVPDWIEILSSPTHAPAYSSSLERKAMEVGEMDYCCFS